MEHVINSLWLTDGDCFGDAVPVGIFWYQIKPETQKLLAKLGLVSHHPLQPGTLQFGIGIHYPLLEQTSRRMWEFHN